MAEGIPTEVNVSGSQIHPLLRQRMSNRAATFSEGAQPSNRRRSSIFSESSDTRHPLFRPSGSDINKLTTSDEPSLWHSLPLAFAILPAVSGLFFQNGSAIVTDFLLLGFGSMFLNWCVRAPWDWYHAAQQVQYAEEDENPSDDDELDELDDEDVAGIRDADVSTSTEPKSSKVPVDQNKRDTPTQTDTQKSAGRELRREEIIALVACFLGPILGAYILHALRSQLSRPAEGLVSNYNLTIFIMAAELRPFAHIIKMKQARMVHLQRIANISPSDRLERIDAQDLSRRLADVEARVAAPVTGSDAETAKLSATIHQSLQPQLDALNRAVRRYEKRQVAQSIQIEARFGELETRLHDALSLAAAAARTGQRPGIVSVVLTWVINFVKYAVHTSWAVVTYPYNVALSMALVVRAWLVKTDRQPRKRVKGQGNGDSPIPPTTMSSRSGKRYS